MITRLSLSPSGCDPLWGGYYIYANPKLKMCTNFIICSKGIISDVSCSCRNFPVVLLAPVMGKDMTFVFVCMCMWCMYM